jgi:hypothetical protein
MPYTITPQGNDPILLVKITDPFDFRTGPSAIRARLLNIFSDIARPFLVIYDIRGFSITFNDVVMALADTIYAQDDTKGIFQKYGRILLLGQAH